MPTGTDLCPKDKPNPSPNRNTNWQKNQAKIAYVLLFFCGQVLLESKEPQKLLGLTAAEHLQITKEYALDVSQFSDLYQSEDPHFYDGIPEYEMLKRGMTEEERVKNGYWVAYKIADVLEKKLGR